MHLSSALDYESNETKFVFPPRFEYISYVRRFRDIVIWKLSLVPLMLSVFDVVSDFVDAFKKITSIQATSIQLKRMSREYHKKENRNIHFKRIHIL